MGGKGEGQNGLRPSERGILAIPGQIVAVRYFRVNIFVSGQVSGGRNLPKSSLSNLNIHDVHADRDLPSEDFTALRFGIDDVCNLDQRRGLAQDFLRDRVSRHCGSVSSRISTGTNSIRPYSYPSYSGCRGTLPGDFCDCI